MARKPRKNAKNKAILCISDLHMPYHHPDTIPFLRALKEKYSPDRIISVGDEIDSHGISFWSSDVDLFSAGHELEQAIHYMKELIELFPEMDIMESNHGSLHLRRAKADGIPIHYMKSYNDILEAPKTWKWHESLIVKLPTGQDCYFSHGQGGKAIKVSQTMAMCCVQGHRHSEFGIDYWSNPSDLMWAMQIGCMIDKKSMAFAYNKYSPKRPILGHGIIIDGIPKLLPMLLNSKGRWCGYAP